MEQLSEMKPLTIAQLVDRIHTVLPDYERKKATKLQILEIAVHLGVLTDLEIRWTTPKRHRVVKSYLHTVVRDKKTRRRLETFATCFSRLWSRALVLLNFSVHHVARISMQRQSEPRRYVDWWLRPKLRDQTPGKTFYNMAFKGPSISCPTFLRHLILPELWDREDLDAHVGLTLEVRKHDVNHLYTNQWKRFPRRALHQAITYLSRRMRGNIQIHVRRACIKGVKLYIKRLRGGGNPKPLLKLLTKPWPKYKFPTGVRFYVIRHIHMLRDVLGVADESYLPREAGQFTADLCDLYFYLFRIGLVKSRLMPLGTPGRKYCPIDEIIARSLFGEPTNRPIRHSESEDCEGNRYMLESLGFTPARFAEIQNDKRRRLRRQAKARQKNPNPSQRRKKVFNSLSYLSSE